MITVARPAESAVQSGVRVFRIKELIGSGRDAADLVKGITETVEPECWTPVTPSATIRVLPGLLVIRHNRLTLQRIAEFLETAGKRDERQ
jgi:hypothetical protein